MRTRVVYTCPLAEVDGRRYVFPFTIHSILVDQIVGWVNVIEMEIDGDVYMLLDANVLLDH